MEGNNNNNKAEIKENHPPQDRPEEQEEDTEGQEEDTDFGGNFNLSDNETLEESKDNEDAHNGNNETLPELDIKTVSIMFKNVPLLTRKN